jgi:uncharacterized membrane protein YheB (UPF0754 family)
MTEQKAPPTKSEQIQLDLVNSLEQELDRARWLGKNTYDRLQTVEAQLNSLRDAAREIIKDGEDFRADATVVIIYRSLLDRLQDELNKE